MRGIENIIKMRLAGKKPTMVTVELMQTEAWCKKLTDEPGKFVDLHMTPRDVASVELADLRCLNGVGKVLVRGANDRDVDRVAIACINAGAKVVEAITVQIISEYKVEINRCARFVGDTKEIQWQQ